MNNQEPRSRVKRYDFNRESSNPSPDRKQQFRIWPWILILIVIIVVLIGGIKWFTKNDQSANPSQKTTTSRQARIQSSHHVKSNSMTQSSSVKSKSKTTKPSSTEHPHQSPSKDQGSVFAGDHQFSSVQDAQSWARATQNGWLKAGYNNYTISSDGQGYYILRFTK